MVRVAPEDLIHLGDRIGLVSSFLTMSSLGWIFPHFLPRRALPCLQSRHRIASGFSASNVSTHVAFTLPCVRSASKTGTPHRGDRFFSSHAALKTTSCPGSRFRTCEHSVLRADARPYSLPEME